MQRVAYRNVRVWDGVADGYADADAVVVEHGRIAAVGQWGEIPGGAESRDMGGLTVLPGLIDAHVHMTLDPALRTPEEQLRQPDAANAAAMVERARAMVRAGITTARDLGGGKWLELALRDSIDRGEAIGPRLLCAGQPVTSPAGHCHFWGGEAADAKSAMEVIERQARHGVDLIKIMATGGMLTPGTSPRKAQFDRATTAAIVAGAHEHGYGVAAHCHGTEGIDHAARAGVNTIEHCSWLGDDGRRSGYVAAVAARIGRQGIWVSPTINLGWKRFIGGNGEAQVQATFGKMRAAGVRLIASTDAGIPNVRHEDLPLALPVFAHFAGLTPLETLRSATSDGARGIGLGELTGQVAAGMVADLLFVEGDPLADLATLATPAMVAARGKEVALG